MASQPTPTRECTGWMQLDHEKRYITSKPVYLGMAYAQDTRNNALVCTNPHSTMQNKTPAVSNSAGRLNWIEILLQWHHHETPVTQFLLVLNDIPPCLPIREHADDGLRAGCTCMQGYPSQQQSCLTLITRLGTHCKENVLPFTLVYHTININ